MPLTEAEIIRATQAFIERERLDLFMFYRSGTGGFRQIPLQSVLLKYEEEMRRLHEAKA